MRTAIKRSSIRCYLLLSCINCIVITVAERDIRRYPEIGEQIWRLTHRHEQLVERRGKVKHQRGDVDSDDYFDLVLEKYDELAHNRRS